MEPGAKWLVVALLMSKRQIVVSNLVKVDCCLKGGGDLFHPWRLMRVASGAAGEAGLGGGAAGEADLV
jgi:hypothetical protein